jgi:Ring finger domain
MIFLIQKEEFQCFLIKNSSYCYLSLNYAPFYQLGQDKKKYREMWLVYTRYMINIHLQNLHYFRQLEALRKSQDIECSVCLERVLSKPTAAERKFGLLSECDHPFCVSCIRNWRSNSQHDSGIDVNQAVRACPICRRLSYYVIPSVIWYFSKEEKQEIMDSYKAKLKYVLLSYCFSGLLACWVLVLSL